MKEKLGMTIIIIMNITTILTLKYYFLIHLESWHTGHQYPYLHFYYLFIYCSLFRLKLNLSLDFCALLCRMFTLLKSNL